MISTHAFKLVRSEKGEKSAWQSKQQFMRSSHRPACGLCAHIAKSHLCKFVRYYLPFQRDKGTHLD